MRPIVLTASLVFCGAAPTMLVDASTQNSNLDKCNVACGNSYPVALKWCTNGTACDAGSNRVGHLKYYQGTCTVTCSGDSPSPTPPPSPSSVVAPSFAYFVQDLTAFSQNQKTVIAKTFEHVIVRGLGHGAQSEIDMVHSMTSIPNARIKSFSYAPYTGFSPKQQGCAQWGMPNTPNDCYDNAVAQKQVWTCSKQGALTVPNRYNAWKALAGGVPLSEALVEWEGSYD